MTQNYTPLKAIEQFYLDTNRFVVQIVIGTPYIFPIMCSYSLN